MRKTKHFVLALLVVTCVSSTVWASDLPILPGKSNSCDSNAAKTAYAVQWNGETVVTYNTLPQTGLTATYVDGSNVTHTLALTFENGDEIINSPNYPKNAGTWIVTAHSPQPGDQLENNTSTLIINPAPVTVTGAAAEIAKFADGTLAGVVTDEGTLNGVLGTDDVRHLTTAIFSDNMVGTGKTITLYYALLGEMRGNYRLTEDSAFYTNVGVVIPNMLPDTTLVGDDTTLVQNGIDVYAYGYCTGTGYSVRYHLISGNPDQYRIAFGDSRFTNVNWTDLTTPGANGTVDINVPVDLPTGDYTMDIIFRDSRFPALESMPVTVSFHVNLPETYTMPLFDNVIALVDTCNCFTDIQWFHRADANSEWQAIPGATEPYYREEGGLTGEYFVRAKMNGVDTYTCPQTDMTTLIADEDQAVTVSAYPNPTTESITLNIEGSRASCHTLQVVNTLGVMVEHRTFEGTSTTIDMQSYQRGNYMVSVDGIVVRVIRN
jgi:hypothetical protein